ncbi:hypothetical protein EDB83DRAFT_2554998 [Lactarius deliciosus]|nr:hypothetical protein EDB83DRAFT_2554998 [Lactarius deliciosus]
MAIPFQASGRSEWRGSGGLCASYLFLCFFFLVCIFNSSSVGPAATRVIITPAGKTFDGLRWITMKLGIGVFSPNTRTLDVARRQSVVSLTVAGGWRGMWARHDPVLTTRLAMSSRKRREHSSVVRRWVVFCYARLGSLALRALDFPWDRVGDPKLKAKMRHVPVPGALCRCCRRQDSADADATPNLPLLYGTVKGQVANDHASESPHVLISCKRKAF